MIIKVMQYEYYYNNVPGHGPCRNNLIYTSLISLDKKIFVQWYYNDTEYHKGQNQVIDPSLMEEKWNREVKFLIEMSWKYEDLVPKILEINHKERKIYLSIDGVDFWQRSNCSIDNYSTSVPDWQEQMLKIITAHSSLGIYKYSMHPSSYFVVDGKLKSINYFFAYKKDEPMISIADVESHIYSTRQEEMKKHLTTLDIKWNQKQSFTVFNKLCWESFRTNYPDDFINKALSVTGN